LLGILVTLLTGIPIELLQIEFSRIPEFGDVWRNLVGCFVGLSFFSPKVENLSKGWKRFLKTFVIMLVLVEITAPVKNIIDETIACRQFPLLAGFETPFETGRWRADNGISRTQSPVYSGKYAAEILLTTEKYSRVSLEYFPRDWHQYEKLMFSIYNTKNMNLQLSLRIHDGQHLQNNEPYDRYAQSIILTPGWNVIEIPLQKLKNAPRDRKMDLRNIYNFMIYSSFLSDSTWIYLDDVRLR
jgi:hypothetical protein